MKPRAVRYRDEASRRLKKRRGKIDSGWSAYRIFKERGYDNLEIMAYKLKRRRGLISS